MYFIIDGYNLLFTLSNSSIALAEQRRRTIIFLQKIFASRRFYGCLIFDGAVGPGESGRSLANPLEIFYTQKNQSADDYITEKIISSKIPNQMIVVTNDRALAARVRSLNAQVMHNAAFIKRITTHSKGKNVLDKPPVVETQKEFERLLKIFLNQK